MVWLLIIFEFEDIPTELEPETGFISSENGLRKSGRIPFLLKLFQPYFIDRIEILFYSSSTVPSGNQWLCCWIGQKKNRCTWAWKRTCYLRRRNRTTPSTFEICRRYPLVSLGVIFRLSLDIFWFSDCSSTLHCVSCFSAGDSMASQ